jgi:hypothetical protein
LLIGGCQSLIGLDDFNKVDCVRSCPGDDAGDPGAGTGGSSNSSGAGGASATTTAGNSDGSANMAGGSGGGAAGAGGSAGAETMPDAAVDVGEATDARADGADAACGTSTHCALKAGLVHRYSFNGSGNVVIDSVGNANGNAINAQLNGTGSLTLDGTSGYVDLPNGIVSSLSDATFEIWLTWNGGGGWQRLWDFGNTMGPEGSLGPADTEFYASPVGNSTLPELFAAFKRSDQMNIDETRALSNQPLMTGSMMHVAVVMDQTNHQMSLYRNGSPNASTAWGDSLSMLIDVDNWIGRSIHSTDPSLDATIHEFRIYDVALSQAAVRASFLAGTDPTFLN